MEKLDFSKIEDQKKFDNLPEKERERIVDDGREEAEEIKKQAGIQEKSRELADKITNIKNSYHRKTEEIDGKELLSEAIDKEDKKNGKILKINIPEIGEIEYFEKTVMFPDRIVEETGGVMGYIRKRIDEKFLNNVTEQEKKDYGASFVKNKTLISAIREITKGNFPDKIFNHVFEGYSSHPDAISVFKEERLMLQEIASSKSLMRGIYRKGGFNSFEIKTNNKISKIEEVYPDDNRDILNSFNPANKHLYGRNGYFLFEEVKKYPGFCFASEGIDTLLKGEIWDVTPRNNTEGKLNYNPLFGFGHLNKVFNRYLSLCKKIIEDLHYDKFNELIMEHLRRQYGGIQGVFENFNWEKKEAIGRIEYMQGKITAKDADNFFVKDIPQFR